MKEQHTISYEVVDTSELSSSYQKLMEAAMEATDQAYAPYSKFYVGAALLLSNGEVVKASNKENASFPAGTCAERNALNYASDHFPDQKIRAIAVSANSKEFEMSHAVAPCGICRQVICETEKVQETPIQILMYSPAGKVIILDRANDLLPFHFYVKELKK
ncbi:MAG: cytidine deaminase [Salibacteraceae bacterium]